jgi:hypothetical protein
MPRVKIAFAGEKSATEAVNAAAERKRGSVATEAAVRATQTEAELIRGDRLEAKVDRIKAIAMMVRFARAEKIRRPDLDFGRTTAPAPELEEAVMSVLKAEQEYDAAVRSRYPIIEAIGSIDHTTGATYSDAMLGARVRNDLFDQSGSDPRRGRAHAERLAARANVEAAEMNL